MADFIVLFNTSNAYVIKNEIDKYRGYPNALVNPDLSGVDKVDTIFWKPSGNKVVALTGRQKRARLKKVMAQGRDMRIDKFYRFYMFHPKFNLFVLAVLMLIIFLSIFAVVHHVRS